MTQRIGFEHENILTINGYTQHTDDTVPKALALLVQDAEFELIDRMEHLVKAELEADPLNLPTRPTILIARMALLQEIDEVLTFDAIESPLYIFDNHKYLKEPYLDYFVELSSGPFAPIAVRQSGEETIQGIWLGVTIPK